MKISNRKRKKLDVAIEEYDKGNITHQELLDWIISIIEDRSID